MFAGTIPPKPHVVFRSARARLRYEECLTRSGFEGAFSILYHDTRPHEATPCAPVARFASPERASEPELRRRHYRALALPDSGGPPLVARTPLLFNDHVTLGFARPREPDAAYFVNSDGDELYFVLSGAGTLRSAFGDLRFESGDYVCVPKGILHRFVPDAGVSQAWLWFEFKAGLSLPKSYRNAVGQLRMDAPYSHRDFRKPDFVGPLDEGLRDQVVKRQGNFFGFRWANTPLDVVGWDGAVYPFALQISAFQPRVGQIHLPPPVHATFESNGAVVCSFVPRLLDFHPDANPCPYPHASVDVDEVLFYANESFGSRRGVAMGSISHHPAGITHGPHPGAYETAHGKTQTDELAVMLDVASPLYRTPEAVSIEDLDYHRSFVS